VIIADLEFSRLESWSRDPFLQVLVSVLNLWVLADWADLTHHLIQLSRRGFKTCLFKTKTKTKTKTCLSKTKTQQFQDQDQDFDVQDQDRDSRLKMVGN